MCVVFRNDLTLQISQINHRIDNLAQQINNNKHSPSASNIIQKLKTDENKELRSNNGVTTTEDSDLQQDRLLIDKEGKLSFQIKTILLWTCLTFSVNCVLTLIYIKNSKIICDSFPLILKFFSIL